MKTEYNQATVAETEREKRKWEESVYYQQELEKQLDEQEQKRQQAYEEFLKEKLMIDEIVRKIYEEDKRCVQSCMCYIFFMLIFCRSCITIGSN